MNLYAQTVPTISEYYTQRCSEIRYHDIELSHVVLHDPVRLRGPSRDCSPLLIVVWLNTTR
jgi:hypothetical protein